MKKKYQYAESIAIIGGADGPTSIFVSDKSKKMPFKVRIKNYFYQRKRKKASKQIVVGTHTLEEMLLYAKSIYSATEANYKLGQLPTVSRIYEIKEGNNCLDIEIDDARETFVVSFSCSKKAKKDFQRITKDLYRYYGVSEEDIKERSERYTCLLGVLSQ